MQLVVYIVLLSLCLGNQSTLAFKAGNKPIELDMAKNSAAYIFTQTQEADEAAIGYITTEWANRSDFLTVWNNASNVSWPKCKIPSGLRREHLMAIHAYAQNSSLYSEFNKAVREYGVNDATYKQRFHFKSFHYLLSVALDRLKNNKHCTFRGAATLFNARSGDKVRLGQFASSSLDEFLAKRFMNRTSSENTLFKIVTKLGVPISEFSHMAYEKEVLIPPIEVFKVQREPVRVKQNNLSWRNISLAAKGCQGIPVTVQTHNGALEVKRGKGKCPKHCNCI